MTNQNQQGLKRKNYFKVGERAFIKKFKKPCTIKELDIDKKEAVVDYYNDSNQVETKTFMFWDLDSYRRRDTVLFAKVYPDAKIPTKNDEDGCYDIYACFDEENMIIKSHEIKPIPTGIASSMLPKYRVSLRERGSTGIIGLATRAGQIDSGYRDQWFVLLQNLNKKHIEITKTVDKVEHYEDYIKYPYSKAICQAAIEFVPNVNIKEIDYKELKNIPSERGLGRLGSSGK